MIQKNRVHIIVISILNHLPKVVPSCAEVVFGYLAGVIGCIQANEVIKIILEKEEPFVRKDAFL